MKTALITGSSKGLGSSLAMVYAKYGYSIILSGRDNDSLDSIRNKIMDYNVRCEIVSGDIVNPKTVDKIIDISKKRNIDILINNAGVYLNKSFDETSNDEFRKLMEVNFFSVITITKQIFSLMISKQSGTIVNINSLAGKNGSNGETAYSASKHALRGFSTSLQFDATKNGIRVVDVYLGAMKTNMTIGREDNENFISIDEASEVIFHSCNEYNSLRINEINLSRRIY